MCSAYDEEIDAFISKHVGTIKEDNLDDIFKKFDKDGNGFIEKTELEDFVKEIASDELCGDSLKELTSELFNKLDKNHDGKIDKNELKAILPTEANFLHQFCHHGKTICGVDFIKIWNHYDVNNNGSLEGSELDQFLRDLILKSRPHTKCDEALEKKVKDLKPALLRKFKKQDSGSLSRNDLFDLLQVDATSPSFQGKSAEEFEKIFANYDKDKNGTIEGAELAKLLADLLVLEGDGITERDMEEYSNTVLSKLDRNHDNKIQKSELKDFLQIKD